MVRGLALFVPDFDAVFTACGPEPGMSGSRLVRRQDLLIRRLGVLVIIMELVLLGKFSWLQQTAGPP